MPRKKECPAYSFGECTFSCSNCIYGHLDEVKDTKDEGGDKVVRRRVGKKHSTVDG